MNQPGSAELCLVSKQLLLFLYAPLRKQAVEIEIKTVLPIIVVSTAVVLLYIRLYVAVKAES